MTGAPRDGWCCSEVDAEEEAADHDDEDSHEGLGEAELR